MAGEALYDANGARLILPDGSWAIADAAGTCTECCGEHACDGVVRSGQTCNVLVPCVNPLDAACPGCTVLPDSTIELATLNAAYANGAHVTNVVALPTTLRLVNPGTGSEAFPGVANTEGVWWSGTTIVRVLFRPASGWAQDEAQVRVPILVRAAKLSDTGTSNIEWRVYWKVAGVPATALDVQVDRRRSDGSSRTYTIGLRFGLSQAAAAYPRTTGCGPCDGTPMASIVGTAKLSAYVVALQGTIGSPQAASTATLWTGGLKMQALRTGKTTAECLGCSDVATCWIETTWSAEETRENNNRTTSDVYGSLGAQNIRTIARMDGRVRVRWNAAAPNVVDVQQGAYVHVSYSLTQVDEAADGTISTAFSGNDGRLTINADNCWMTVGGAINVGTAGLLNDVDWCGPLAMAAFGAEACCRAPGSLEWYGLPRMGRQAGTIDAWAFTLNEGNSGTSPPACVTTEGSGRFGQPSLSIETLPNNGVTAPGTLKSTSATAGQTRYCRTEAPTYVYDAPLVRTVDLRVPEQPESTTRQDVVVQPAWNVSKAAGCFVYTGSNALDWATTQRVLQRVSVNGADVDETRDTVYVQKIEKSVKWKLQASGLYGWTVPPSTGGDGTHYADCAQPGGLAGRSPTLADVAAMVMALG